MLKFSEFLKFSRENSYFEKFEWCEWFEWFGPSPIEPFNPGEGRVVAELEVDAVVLLPGDLPGPPPGRLHRGAVGDLSGVPGGPAGQLHLRSEVNNSL